MLDWTQMPLKGLTYIIPWNRSSVPGWILPFIPPQRRKKHKHFPSFQTCTWNKLTPLNGCESLLWTHWAVGCLRQGELLLEAPLILLQFYSVPTQSDHTKCLNMNQVNPSKKKILDAQPGIQILIFQEGKFPKHTENQSFNVTAKQPFEAWSATFPCPKGWVFPVFYEFPNLYI